MIGGDKMGIFDKLKSKANEQASKVRQDYYTDKSIKKKIKAKEFEDEKVKIRRKYAGAGLTDAEVERVVKKEKQKKKVDNILGNFANAAGNMSGTPSKPKKRAAPARKKAAPAKKKSTGKRKRTSSRRVKEDTFGFNF